MSKYKQVGTNHHHPQDLCATSMCMGERRRETTGHVTDLTKNNPNMTKQQSLDYVGTAAETREGIS